ncbi:hypothetical protein Q5S73_004708 [Salmonella enterica]|nr:hypothetical protein [Salmonella enterica]
MLFTKWRFLFNIDSNSRNPSFVKVDLKEGPAAMRGFLRFNTTFLKAPYHLSPEHIQIPLLIRGDGVGRFTQKKTQHYGWDS